MKASRPAQACGPLRKQRAEGLELTGAKRGGTAGEGSHDFLCQD